MNEEKIEAVKNWVLLVVSTIIGFFLSTAIFTVILVFILTAFGIL